MRWKPALNAFDITFADRMPAPENLEQQSARYTVRLTLPLLQVADDVDRYVRVGASVAGVDVEFALGEGDDCQV